MTTTFSPLDQALQFTEQMIQRKLLEQKHYSNQENAEYLVLLEWIAFIKADVRTYAIGAESQIQDLWNKIRQEDIVVDFVLSMTHELFWRLGLPQWISLKEMLVHSLTLWSERGVMDESLLTRLPTTDMKTLIDHNPWLIIIYLMGLLPDPSIRIYGERYGRNTS